MSQTLRVYNLCFDTKNRQNRLKIAKNHDFSSKKHDKNTSWCGVMTPRRNRCFTCLQDCLLTTTAHIVLSGKNLLSCNHGGLVFDVLTKSDNLMIISTFVSRGLVYPSSPGSGGPHTLCFPTHCVLTSGCPVLYTPHLRSSY